MYWPHQNYSNSKSPTCLRVSTLILLFVIVFRLVIESFVIDTTEAFGLKDFVVVTKLEVRKTKVVHQNEVACLVMSLNGMFVWRDFREVEKLRREKWKESIFSRCLVGREEKSGRVQVFSLKAHQNGEILGEKTEGKTIMVWSRLKYKFASARGFVISLPVWLFILISFSFDFCLSGRKLRGKLTQYGVDKIPKCK